MATIAIDDTTIHYERSGDGPAVLFVHGMYGHADVWADQAARLSDRYTCVRYDRRGYGRSDRGTAPLSVRRHADDAVSLIEALDLAPCLLVGSSSGAAIGVDVALRRGDLLRGAVLSEPPLLSIDPDAAQAFMDELMPRFTEAVERGGPRAAVDAFLSFVCPGLWSIVDEPAKDRYRANAEIGMADLGSPSLAITASDLDGVDVPCLALHGTTSHPTFVAITLAMAAALPDVRVVQIADSGHVMYAEQPDAFAEAVSAFAAELDRRVPAGARGAGGRR